MRNYKRIITLISLGSLFQVVGMSGCQVESESERLYQVNCMNCHGTNGEGLRQLIPPLADSDFLQENQDRLACIIRHGLKGEVTVNDVSYNYPMPGNQKLSEVDITNIINYINRKWSKGEATVSPGKVKRQLQLCTE